MDHHRLFIGGELVDARDGARFETLDPGTGSPIATVASAGEGEIDDAVMAARRAFDSGEWSALDPVERAARVMELADLIQASIAELALLEALDSGGLVARTGSDVFQGARFLRETARYAAHQFPWTERVPGKSPFFPASNSVRREPIGVCAAIIPWNFPLLMAAWKLAPALACGNTVVLKPAETTSLTALRLAEIFEEVGLPNGVVNIVTGDGRTGAAIVDHPGIHKIAFTGSTEVGKRIARAVAGTSKRLTLELGGKSPNIIFEDASIDQAIEGIIEGIYFNQGHVCCAGSRLFVQESILDTVRKKLSHRLKSLRVGDPLDKNTDIGAINSASQLSIINKYIEAGKREGAKLHEVNGSPLPSKGYYCRPSFFTDVQPSHTIAREEIFGPVLAVMSFRTPEEALTRANNTPYGLAAGVWTDKGSKIFQIASKLRAGVVWCNTYNRFDPASPFGGYKESGFGREGGMQGLRAYVSI